LKGTYYLYKYSIEGKICKGLKLLNLEIKINHWFLDILKSFSDLTLLDHNLVDELAIGKKME
jgi:hypothetical protein